MKHSQRLAFALGSCLKPLTVMADWLEKGLLQRLVLVITSAYTKEVLERWTFEIETDKEVKGGG